MDPLTIITHVAQTQNGIITTGQALEAGLSRHQISTLCRAGRWRRLAHGAYHISPAGGPQRRARIQAVLSSFGRNACAVLSTAAELHAIAGLHDTATIHVAVPRHDPHQQRRSDPRIRVH